MSPARAYEQRPPEASTSLTADEQHAVAAEAAANAAKHGLLSGSRPLSPTATPSSALVQPLAKIRPKPFAAVAAATTARAAVRLPPQAPTGAEVRSKAEQTCIEPKEEAAALPTYTAKPTAQAAEEHADEASRRPATSPTAVQKPICTQKERHSPKVCWS